MSQAANLHHTGPLAVAATQNEDVEEPWSTYLHLWHAILQLDPPDPTPGSPAIPPHPKLKSTGKTKGSKLGLQTVAASREQAAAEQHAVYNALVRAVLDAVSNLDLEYHQAQSDGGSDAERLSSPDTKAALRQVCMVQHMPDISAHLYHSRLSAQSMHQCCPLLKHAAVPSARL